MSASVGPKISPSPLFQRGVKVATEKIPALQRGIKGDLAVTSAAANMLHFLNEL
jgi:hypothetical protein